MTKRDQFPGTTTRRYLALNNDRNYYEFGSWLALKQAGMIKSPTSKLEVTKTEEMPTTEYKGKKPNVSRKKAPNRVSSYAKTVFPTVK